MTRSAFLALVLPALLLATGPVAAQTFPLGDELTTIQRPLLNIPAFARPGDTFPIECEAPSSTTGWQAELIHKSKNVALTIQSAVYDPSTLWWTLQATVPADVVLELYDLRVTADGGIDDTTWNAVSVIPAYRDSYYFVHVTDAHMPDHQFSSSGGAPADSTEMQDMRAVIEDINLLNPEFVLFTGDLINEGELEDYLGWRSYSRVQYLLTELEVPVFVTAGNHDIGGWDSTPPPDGEARRNWWRFFGWNRLDNPPPGAPARTQDYSFDYGPVHYVGLESYNNYDDWRDWIYGADSYTSEQLDWLDADLAQAHSQAEVLFHHSDMQNQLNLSSLGIELSLSGHIHYDSGSLYSTPWDLTTDNVCDGARSYRVVQVTGGSTLAPQATVQAGYSGEEVTVSYTPANDGLHDQVTAVIDNNHNLRFANARLKIRMPKGAGSTYAVTGGNLVQVDDSGDDAVCHVAVDVYANRTATVTVTRETSSPVGDAPAIVANRLLPAYPNPFNPATTLSYELSAPQEVRFAVYDLGGRRIAVLDEGERTAGRHEVRWEGRDQAGQSVPSGVYLVQLVLERETLTHRIVLAK